MKPKQILETASGLLSALALFAIMALTFFDVLGRKFANNSIPGSLEMTEMLMVVVIFASLPLVSMRGEHVLFDSMDPYLPEAVVKVQKAVIHALLALLLIGLAYLMWREGGNFAAAGETTAQLKVPKAPFIYGMSVLSALAGLVHIALIFQPPPDLAEGEGAAL
ncbi:MAG TPA: TRAP transporter small permease [Ramlibacter sp.]|nr:TRAP transporter small permease [Ramlibacter sp.]